MSEKLANSNQALRMEWEEAAKAARAAAWEKIEDAEDAVDVAREEHEVNINARFDAQRNLEVAEAARDETWEKLEAASDAHSAAWEAWEELCIEQGVIEKKPASKVSKPRWRLGTLINIG